MRILVVDDEAPVRKILSTMLTRMGHDVCCCESCTETLRSELDQPDVILLDGMLGDERGPDHIPALHVTFPDARIVGMSGIMPAEAFLEAGAQHFLAKPFTVESLGEVLEQIATSRAAR